MTSHNGFTIGDKVTWADGGWWGNAKIAKVFKSGVYLDDNKRLTPYTRIRKGHSKNYDEVCYKF